MQYIGLHAQQARNNFRSVLLLCLFPCLVILLTFLFSVLLVYFTAEHTENLNVWDQSLAIAGSFAPYVLIGVTIWFLIAYFANTAMIRSATGARPLNVRKTKGFTI